MIRKNTDDIGVVGTHLLGVLLKKSTIILVAFILGGIINYSQSSKHEPKPHEMFFASLTCNQKTKNSQLGSIAHARKHVIIGQN